MSAKARDALASQQTFSVGFGHSNERNMLSCWSQKNERCFEQPGTKVSGIQFGDQQDSNLIADA